MLLGVCLEHACVHPFGRLGGMRTHSSGTSAAAHGAPKPLVHVLFLILGAEGRGSVAAHVMGPAMGPVTTRAMATTKSSAGQTLSGALGTPTESAALVGLVAAVPGARGSMHVAHRCPR